MPQLLIIAVMSKTAVKATNRHVPLQQKVPTHDIPNPTAPKNGESDSKTYLEDLKGQTRRRRRNDGNGNLHRSHSPLPRRPSFADYKRSVCSLSKLDASKDSEQDENSISIKFRAAVKQAKEDHKIFAVHPRYTLIRKTLENRGWVEKTDFEFTSLSTKSSSTSLANLDLDSNDPTTTNEEDRTWVNAELHDYQPDFIFKHWRDKLEWDVLLPHQLVNQHVRNFFTTKIGIAACSRQLQWHSDPGISHTNFSRCYKICDDEEREAFVGDYRLSICIAMLRFITENYNSYGHRGIVDSTGSSEKHFDLMCLKFAVKQIHNYIKFRKHLDLDKHGDFCTFMSINWDNFIPQYHELIEKKLKLSPALVNSNLAAKKLVYECSRCLKQLEPYWPNLAATGTHNVWIIKPGAQSRGKGIVVLNELEKILEYSKIPEPQRLNWIVQKYIERPLLIYATKFDIRQWFMVTDWHPLTVWFYRECYLRFCTTPFDIEDFHESIHLCNNQVQSQYENSAGRDPSLPADNMWDDKRMQTYLESINEGDVWASKIHPGMKQGILGILRASQDIAEVPYRKNCFEIYGADFLLTEDFTPWLIEINMSPCLDNTSSVTAKMCPQCLEDCMKVIIDRRENPVAETGAFEECYHQGASPEFKNNEEVTDVTIVGTAIPVKYETETKEEQSSSVTEDSHHHSPSPIPENSDSKGEDSLMRNQNLNKTSGTCKSTDSLLSAIESLKTVISLGMKISAHTDQKAATKPVGSKRAMSKRKEEEHEEKRIFNATKVPSSKRCSTTRKSAEAKKSSNELTELATPKFNQSAPVENNSHNYGQFQKSNLQRESHRKSILKESRLSTLAMSNRQSASSVKPNETSKSTPNNERNDFKHKIAGVKTFSALPKLLVQKEHLAKKKSRTLQEVAHVLKNENSEIRTRASRTSRQHRTPSTRNSTHPSPDPLYRPVHLPKASSSKDNQSPPRKRPGTFIFPDDISPPVNSKKNLDSLAKMAKGKGTGSQPKHHNRSLSSVSVTHHSASTSKRNHSRPTSAQSHETVKPASGQAIKAIESILGSPLISERSVKTAIRSVFKKTLSLSKSFHSIVVSPSSLRKHADHRYAAINGPKKSTTPRRHSRLSNSNNNGRKSESSFGRTPPAS